MLDTRTSGGDDKVAAVDVNPVHAVTRADGKFCTFSVKDTKRQGKTVQRRNCKVTDDPNLNNLGLDDKCLINGNGRCVLNKLNDVKLKKK